MTPERYQRVKQVFLGALDREPEDRESYLAGACGGDEALRREVGELLRHHEAAGPLPSHAARGATALDTRPTARLLDGAGASVDGVAPRGASRSGSRLIDHGRFSPGAVVSDRYRVVALVGRGGMGEVYRADDLKLGQPVALKFLPPKVASRPGWLEGLINEVRIARQVSHPNVCRVYDIGEVGGDHFITMEYVDGETLDSLLARIGRLPERKALQLAQELCAGLQAVHECGILHRDLKPANVMIDGRGRVRVHDFGLAAGGDLHGVAAAAGTPGYIAPESLAGREATLRSDLYALGLLLYELFTGLPAYPGGKGVDLLREQERRDPPPPSRIVPEIDPVVERVILTCLERDPRNRPGSARQVAAMLPGGDPLAAALAAGETPSPEVVAASGRRGVMRPVVAVGALLLLIGGVLGVMRLSQQASLLQRVPLPKPPAVLADRAQAILASLGYPRPDDRRVYRAFAYDLYQEYLQEILERDHSNERWERLARPRPAAVDFWYRQSFKPFAPASPFGRINMEDPPHAQAGMISMRLSPLGQLRELTVLDPRARWPADGVHGRPAPTGGERAIEPDWAALFAAAELDIGVFERVEPLRIPPVYADTRAAWQGVYPESPDEAIRVEAAGLDGRVVAFRTVELKWPKAQTAGPEVVFSDIQTWGLGLLVTVQLASILGALFLARSNVINRRGDREGALRFAGGMAGATLLAMVLRADSFAGPGGAWALLGWAAAAALLNGVWYGVFYIAVEPYVRRVWPETIVSWARLVGGRARDPLVGQSLLVGSLLGVLAVAVVYADTLTPEWLGLPPVQPYLPNDLGVASLAGPRETLGVTFQILLNATQFATGFLLASVLLKLLLRNTLATLGACAAIQTSIWALLSDTSVLSWVYFGLLASLCCVVLVRYGLLALIVAAFVFMALTAFPVTLQRGVWYADTSFFALAVVAGIGLYGAAASAASGPRAGADRSGPLPT